MKLIHGFYRVSKQFFHTYISLSLLLSWAPVKPYRVTFTFVKFLFNTVLTSSDGANNAAKQGFNDSNSSFRKTIITGLF